MADKNNPAITDSAGKPKINAAKPNISKDDTSGKKESKKSILFKRLLELPENFNIQDLTHGESSLQVAANLYLWRLKKEGTVDCRKKQRDADWRKTDKFEQSILLGKTPKTEIDKRHIVSDKRRAYLLAACQLPRISKSTKVVQVLQLLKSMPEKSFAIRELQQNDDSVKTNTARELIRLLSLEGEVKQYGPRNDSIWDKTDKFGTCALWEMLTAAPGQVKFSHLRKSIDDAATARGAKKKKKVKAEK